jgi:DNA-binding response OmpR family regulator
MSKRVLLIDDDVAALRSMQMMLEDLGFEVETASDGAAGLRLFMAAVPDLVITDIIMPNKEGIETIIEMRRHRPNAKIIAISGGGRMKNKELLHLAAAMGADAVLPKPFELDELDRCVKSALSNGGSPRHPSA